jgi:hypothetical protein
MKDFILNEDILPPFLPIGNFMTLARISRIVDGEDQTLMKVRMITDIDYAKERRAMKFFKK